MTIFHRHFRFSRIWLVSPRKTATDTNHGLTSRTVTSVSKSLGRGDVFLGYGELAYLNRLQADYGTTTVPDVRSLASPRKRKPEPGCAAVLRSLIARQRAVDQPAIKLFFRLANESAAESRSRARSCLPRYRSAGITISVAPPGGHICRGLTRPVPGPKIFQATFLAPYNRAATSPIYLSTRDSLDFWRNAAPIVVPVRSTCS